VSNDLLDLAGDLAVARGGGNVKTDPMELVEGRTLRRRIAALISIPGGAVMLALGGWTSSWVVGLVGFAVLILALWLFADHFGAKPRDGEEAARPAP
jgi:hypothetical protein